MNQAYRRWRTMPPVELDKELAMLRRLMPGHVRIQLLEAFIPEQRRTYQYRE